MQRKVIGLPTAQYLMWGHQKIFPILIDTRTAPRKRKYTTSLIIHKNIETKIK